jgi:hypothetical protein
MLHIFFSVYVKLEKEKCVEREEKVHYLACIALCIRPSVFVRPFFLLRLGTQQDRHNDTEREKKDILIAIDMEHLLSYM